MNEEREKLSEQIHKIYCEYYFKRFGREYHTNGDYSKVDEATKEADRMIADFIIEDRKRICAPLVKIMDGIEDFRQRDDWEYPRAIQETLKLAGLEDGK